MNSAEVEASWPQDAKTEINRINTAPNYYVVLHVTPNSSEADIKRNYYKLARILHPDKCKEPGAEDAMKTVALAYDTLTSPIKKRLYDSYMTDTNNQSGEHVESYAEWEARQGQVQLPAWLERLLRIRGVSWIVLIGLLILLIPLLIIVFLLSIIAWVLCMPVNFFIRIFFPEKYRRMQEEAREQEEQLEAERAAMRAAANA
ncbi:DnaJ homolog subfamily B member 14 [Galdieria sulphuraria]|uniref:DNAJ heat shock family protein n=1 Tax=Galdieria sulphuraria TaxID=130081 RepID=M2X7Z4_GALSU|nr:DNAJ heat shock family protein [Galdieria sulphuraria]EME32675.1 DNAJ heat shock family protein [Galdieria sulphuraria]GJD07879.1 DnaJ homolog subfamily B member 14 [Galdieria sulphuraria]|eukprot:XP_005709195.1 DNAJ heat shock family protein [Galdieria sulphuraria]